MKYNLMDFHLYGLVSPRKGRWIEISIVIYLSSAFPFLPVRGDGLKSTYFSVKSSSVFLPVRGDGLKYDSSYGWRRGVVSPRKGRWIEIFITIFNYITDGVSPRKGRWIEIDYRSCIIKKQGFSP